MKTLQYFTVPSRTKDIVERFFGVVMCKPNGEEKKIHEFLNWKINEILFCCLLS